MLRAVYLTSESYIDHSYTIVNGLRQRSDELVLKVFFQAKESTEEVQRWCERTGGEFVKRKRFRNPMNFFDDLKLLRKVKKLNVDIVWFNTQTVFQAILAPLMLKKYVVMMHDVDPHPDSKERHGTLASGLTLRFSKRKIAVASATQAELFQKKYGIRPMVFRLPVITYFRDLARGEEIRNKNNHVRFFFFGSIEKYKGIETLIEAAEILEQKGLEFEVNIHGKVKYDKAELSGRIDKLKNVNLFDEFIDYREIHSVYSGNDIQVLPYKQVTQCGPLLIGFSECVPSICNDLAGFREYVSDGVDGIIFNGTPAGLAEKMEAIIKDRAMIEKLKKGIINNGGNKFDIGKLAEEYIKSLNKAVTS